MFLNLRIGKIWIIYEDGLIMVFDGVNRIIGGDLLYSYSEHRFWVAMAWTRFNPKYQDDIPFS